MALKIILTLWWVYGKFANDMCGVNTICMCESASVCALVCVCMHACFIIHIRYICTVWLKMSRSKFLTKVKQGKNKNPSWLHVYTCV